MSVDASVSHYSSALAGAPSLSGQAGALIAVLDAVLVNGWGVASVDSITISGGIATVTKSAGHPFQVGMVSEIAGATVSGGSVNGRQKVLTVPNGTSYTFDATGLANQTATGSITYKIASLQWNKVYSGTNLAAYKSSNGFATGVMLRVDDTGTQNARVVGYESMTDVNTGTNPFPTAAQQSGGGFWPKSNTADSTVRAWDIIGDDRTFYISMFGLASGAATWGFGDHVSYKSPDPYAGFICSAGASLVGNSQTATELAFCANNYVSTSVGVYLTRAYTGLGGAIIGSRSVNSCTSQSGLFSGQSSGQHFAYPNGSDNSVIVTPVEFWESGIQRRGVAPGLYFLPQSISTTGYAHRDTQAGVSGLTGRLLKMLLNTTGPLGFDVTGPWR